MNEKRAAQYLVNMVDLKMLEQQKDESGNRFNENLLKWTKAKNCILVQKDEQCSDETSQ